jgi:hypothetical protein
MTKLKLVLAMATIVIGSALMMWQVEATPLTQAADSLGGLKAYSSVQQAGCIFGTSRCPAGTKWQCTKTPAEAGVIKKCKCRTC